VIYTDFDDIPRGGFQVICSDPPWGFRSWSDKGRDRSPDAMVRQKGLAERHYATMPMSEIRKLPVGDLAAKNCALFLWAVDCMLPEALEVGGNPEMCLLFTRGAPKRQSAAVRQLIVDERREHSRKPEAYRERVEALLPGPYLEMFARQPREGWSSWGNQVGIELPQRPKPRRKPVAGQMEIFG
jgi:N6-adenosine-specific RNA methylase IME4